MENNDKRIFTIPNILSLIRLIIAPFIVYAYIGLKNYNTAAILVVASGLTDMLDGFIARNFDQTSDLGKVMDPVADKVTQVIMFACLISRYSLMKFLTVVLIIKEAVQSLVVYLAYKKVKVVHSSKWFGKINTVVLYMVCVFLMVFPNMNQNLANYLMYLCLIMLIIAFIGYLKVSLKLIFSNE